MIRIKEPVTKTVTPSQKLSRKVGRPAKGQAMSVAERQRLSRQRKFIAKERERMRGLTDEQFLAETVGADG